MKFLKKITLEKWDAIELVYKIVFAFLNKTTLEQREKKFFYIPKETNYSKREYKDFKEFAQANDPKIFINAFTSETLSDRIVEHIYSSLNKSITTSRKTSLREICLAIDNGDAIQIYIEVYHLLTEYIDELSWCELIEKKNVEFIHDKKEKLLADTKWWLYRYAEEDGQKGVTRSLLNLGQFNKADLYSYYAEMHNIEHFVGRYEVSNESKSFVNFNLKLNDTNILDFNLIVHFGKGLPELVLGCVQAVGEEIIYSAPCMLIRKREEELPTQVFIPFANNDKTVPDFVKEYFDPLFQHIHIISSKYTTPESFRKGWMLESEKKANEISEFMISFKKRHKSKKA